MSFTTDVKKEIIHRGTSGYGRLEKQAALSAFIRTSGTVGIKDGTPTFFIVSETEYVTEFFMASFSELFNTELFITRATMDRRSGRDKLLLQCPAARSEEVLRELGLLKRTGGIREGIASALIAGEAQKIAYVQGAFLGGGSCTIPKDENQTGYHLEVVFYDRETARDFCGVLSDFELIVRLVERKETFVAYLKSKEAISDFLSIIGAENSLRKFSALVEKRDRANHSNRAQNCMAGNADKSAIAAVKQVVAIEKLLKLDILKDQTEELQALARVRLANRAMSMQELADYFKVSKSCLNHRMRRLLELAKKTEDD